MFFLTLDGEVMEKLVENEPAMRKGHKEIVLFSSHI